MYIYIYVYIFIYIYIYIYINIYLYNYIHSVSLLVPANISLETAVTQKNKTLHPE